VFLNRVLYSSDMFILSGDVLMEEKLTPQCCSGQTCGLNGFQYHSYIILVDWDAQ
jgi:hypothetical protein